MIGSVDQWPVWSSIHKSCPGYCDSIQMAKGDGMQLSIQSCRITDTTLVAQMEKNPPTMQETQVQSLGWKDLPEMGMAATSSILAWRIPWTEESGRLQSMGL